MAGCPICPDFLRRLVTLIHSMRLSLMKGAHADLSSTAWQEIGVKPYFGLSGIVALDVPLSYAITKQVRRDTSPSLSDISSEQPPQAHPTPPPLRSNPLPAPAKRRQ